MESTQAHTRWRVPFHASLSDCIVVLSGSDEEKPVRCPAHKFVLSTSSEVFARSIANWSRDGDCVVDVSTTSLRISEALVRFAYFNRIPDDLADRDVVRLVVAADKYAMSALVNACVRRWMIIHRTLEWQSIMDILELPDVVLSSNAGVDAFVKTTLATDVRHRFRDLERAWALSEERQRFMRLPVHSVLDLFSWRDMKASEDAVLIAMMSWMRTKSLDPTVVSALFSTLRIPHLSPYFIHEVLRSDPDLGTLVDRDVLYGVIEHRDMARKRPRHASEPRLAARDKVMAVMTVPAGLVSGIVKRLVATGVSGTMTMRSHRIVYIEGVWWEIFLHVALETGSQKFEIAFGLVPSVRTDRIIDGKKQLNWTEIYKACEAFDVGRNVNMAGISTRDDDPDPDALRMDDTTSQKFIAEMSSSNVSFEKKTNCCSGVGIRAWTPCTLDWFERKVTLNFSVTTKSVDDIREPKDVNVAANLDARGRERLTWPWKWIRYSRQ